MIFLAPLIIVFLIIFGVDYIYFSDKNTQKFDKNLTKNQKTDSQKHKFIDKILK